MADTDVWFRVHRTFLNHLDSMSGLPPVAWENTNYEPTKGTTYVEPFLVPSQTRQASIGVDGTNQLQGIFQVNVYTPAGKGTAEAIALVDDIIEHFTRGLTLTTDNLIVHIEEGWASPNQKRGTDWMLTPVNISWFSYSER